ncbi:MAG TPA: ABC transporter ATP-binding protein [Methylomirabilota bacterium]|jgi:iron(III) transport system ATP-binding protein|nr:ABC transporter ATP-binding protein [Methylomirabilota bacterium]
MTIQIERITKRFGATTAVRDLSLEILDREFVTLLGPSGCGKTTLLRLIAGFVAPDEGLIRVGSATLSTPDGVVPPEQRGMGMVFQNYAVWPHRTVYQNVAFGLEVRKRPKSEIRARVAKILDLVNLGGLDGRYPNQLSGGQQQRVALARSLVVEPGILLLDEPLSNLDAKLRERMRWELKELQRRTGITFVYVTHDQTEAMALSDRIAVMHQGEIIQCGAPREVYTRPTNKTVADFMGVVNLIPGRVIRAAGDHSLIAVGGDHPIAVALSPGALDGQTVQMAIRPESLRLTSLAPGSMVETGIVPGKVAEVTFLGNLTDCHVTLDDGTRIRVQVDSPRGLEVGHPVGVQFDSEATSVFDG